MPPCSSKPAASSRFRGSLDCKGGLALMRDILVSTLCGGTAGLMIAIVENAF
jgi:hypothetical protein